LRQRCEFAKIFAMPDADVTRILEDLAAGRRESAEALLPLVYQQLRAIAKQRMAGERHDHTLQATALVHEAYVKLVGDGGQVNWSGRAAFFKAAAEAMRRILIDHARTRGRVKRGGSSGGGDQAAKRVPLSVLDLAADSDGEDILALDEAICRLEEADPEVASVVRLRFFAGLTAPRSTSERTTRDSSCSTPPHSRLPTRCSSRWRLHGSARSSSALTVKPSP
jgi:RNA polymerase sigma factor (TIGR02999 family)